MPISEVTHISKKAVINSQSQRLRRKGILYVEIAMEKGIEQRAEEEIEILSQKLSGFSICRKVKTNIEIRPGEGVG